MRKPGNTQVEPLALLIEPLALQVKNRLLYKITMISIEDSCSSSESSETDSEEDEKVLQYYYLSREIHRPNWDNFIYPFYPLSGSEILRSYYRWFHL